jgi:hypothetical protein
MAEADLVDAHLALVRGEFNLTQAAGRPLEEAWILPVTPPQSGRYMVAESARGAARHWADAVTSRHRQLEQRAEAVIRADQERASLASSGTASGGGTPLDAALWAVTRQSTQSLDFLGDLTAYNIAVARYALTTLPPNVSSDELVKKLVIERTARGKS